jgi:hypothetical protein
MKEKQKALIKNGVLRDTGDYFVFSQHYTFNSPSLAAAMILGRPANGRDEWADKSGKTLKEMQEAEVE